MLEPAREKILDATDIRQGKLIVHTIVYDQSRAVVASEMARNSALRNRIALEPVRHVFAWFGEHS